MALMQIAEIFGFSTDNINKVAKETRQAKHCPFRKTKCNKSSLKDPIGICSLTDGVNATAVCPVRFLEGARLFSDAGKHAFGPGVEVAVVPEVRILRVKDKNGKNKKIGKVDYLLAQLNTEGKPVDFCALEVQAVYFSGKGIREALHRFLAKGVLNAESKRRPDYRSSAQKRLMPQLSVKVPVFRRWGKRFFVAVDAQFFGALPKFKRVSTIENSEITWLVYPFEKKQKAFSLGEPEIVFTLWDDVLEALREGEAPNPTEILSELAGKVGSAQVCRT